MVGVTEAEMTQAIVAKLRDAAGEMFAAEVEAAVAKLTEGLERHGIEAPETLADLRRRLDGTMAQLASQTAREANQTVRMHAERALQVLQREVQRASERLLTDEDAS